MTATETKWSERVREWRASGKSAETFAGERGFAGSTLRYWSSRLKAAASARPEAAATKPRIARVVRRRESREIDRVAPSDELEVVIGEVRIVIRSGFDAALLSQVVVALGVTR